MLDGNALQIRLMRDQTSHGVLHKDFNWFIEKDDVRDKYKALNYFRELSMPRNEINNNTQPVT